MVSRLDRSLATPFSRVVAMTSCWSAARPLVAHYRAAVG